MANSNRRNNTVESLIVNDVASSDSTEIHEHILQFYTRFCLEQFSWRPKLYSLHFDSIGVEKAL